MRIVAGLVVLLLLVGCGSDELVIGQKTTMEVNKKFDAGQVVKGENVKAVFTVENTGDYPLVISAVTVACSCTLASKPEEPIAPGESATIEATVDTQKTGSGLITKNVTIVANTIPSSTVVQIQANVVNK